MKKVIMLLIISIFSIASAYVFMLSKDKLDGVTVSSFEDCVKAGYPVMESYPRRCRINNQTFTEEIGNELDKQDLIRLETPRPNQLIASPLEIRGSARGNWFFEASFPIRLYDENNNEIAVVVATAQGDWMTTEFVPFKTTLTFKTPETDTGTLVLEKDNPSGLEENADELRIPIRFR